MVVGFPKSMNISKQIDKKLGKLLTQGSGFSVAGNDGRKAQLKQNLKFRSDYGYKFNPSSELAKQWQGWGTCLKPAYEPIIIARKPFKGTLIDNIIENGVGGLDIDECRVETDDKMSYSTSDIKGVTNFGTGANIQNDNGRFPANVILTYDQMTFDEVCGGMPNTKSTGGHKNTEKSNIKNDVYGMGGRVHKSGEHYVDSGSAARYFYCAKASKKDRDEGLELLEDKFPASAEFRPNHMEKALKGEVGNPYGRWQPRKNIHPTVKPTELMQYLIRLVSPKNSIILDPFTGSGSTGKAVMYENKERNANYKFIGIELTEEYLPIAEARISYVINKEEK